MTRAQLITLKLYDRRNQARRVRQLLARGARRVTLAELARKLRERA